MNEYPNKFHTSLWVCRGCGVSHGTRQTAHDCCSDKPPELQSQQVGGTHYLKPVQPWDLMKCMESSGSAFVDGCRCNVIKYAFRNKKDMLEDLKKARHYLDAAIEVLEKKEPR